MARTDGSRRTRPPLPSTSHHCMCRPLHRQPQFLACAPPCVAVGSDRLQDQPRCDRARARGCTWPGRRAGARGCTWPGRRAGARTHASSPDAGPATARARIRAGTARRRPRQARRRHLRHLRHLRHVRHLRQTVALSSTGVEVPLRCGSRRRRPGSRLESAGRQAPPRRLRGTGRTRLRPSAPRPRSPHAPHADGRR